MAGTPSSAPSTVSEARVSTLELFFDLVFVFTIRQLTDRAEPRPGRRRPPASGPHAGRDLVDVRGYAWLTNFVAPDRTTYRMPLLGGMGGFMVLSLAIPHAFSDGGVLFGAAYAAIVLIHSWMFTRSERGESARSILLIAPHNLAMAVLLVVGGAIGGDVQYALWLVAVALILYIAIPGPRGSFELAPGHFVERHALVVIVALGESVVAVGLGAMDLHLERRHGGTGAPGPGAERLPTGGRFAEGGDERLLEAFAGATPRDARPWASTSSAAFGTSSMPPGIGGPASALRHGIGGPEAMLSTARGRWHSVGARRCSCSATRSACAG